jgi:hypothetical protein
MSTPADAVKAAEPSPQVTMLDPLPVPPPPKATALSVLTSLKAQVIGAVLFLGMLVAVYWAASHK